MDRHRQSGSITIFSAILILGLMTLLMVYAGVAERTEQRVSGNEHRQKLAFHAAESAVEQATEFMLGNSLLVLSASPTAAPDGNGGTRPGWFAAGSALWADCPDSPSDDHPCGGAIAAGAGANAFFYDDPSTTTANSFDSLPLNLTGLPTGTTARVTAVMCLVDFASPTGGCIGAPGANDNTALTAYMVTLLAYGYSDCSNPADLTTCTGMATVASPLSNFNFARGSPAVPLTTRTTFPPTGTVEIVPNPNAGGVGVPISVWGNENPTCSSGTSTLAQGSWATCEYSEWYERDEIPAAMACDQPSCQCSSSEAISWTAGTNDFIGIDILPDDEFPCDLFAYFFDVPREQYQIVKAAAKIIPDCDNLDENSQGIYWVTGPECYLGGTHTIGSPTGPVMLVVATQSTTFNGTGNIFGVVFLTDVEDPTAEWNASGTNIVYGSMIIDATLDSFTGTFQIIYNKDVSLLAAGLDGIGPINGGWRDFGLPTVTWEG